MDEFKSTNKDQNKRILLYKTISLSAHKKTLWNRTQTGNPIEIRATSAIPSFKLSNSAKQQLKSCQKDSKLTPSSLISFPIPNSAKDYEIHPFSSTTKTIKKSIPIRLIQSAALEKAVYDDFFLQITEKINSFESAILPEDLTVPLIQKFNQSLQIHLIYPNASFVLHPVPSIKLISTPLSIKLTSKDTPVQPHRSGFLTLDSKMRVLPLKSTDKNVMKYPLVGVWATGCKEDLTDNRSLWAVFLRFVENSVTEKISPSPGSNTFLFISFSPTPAFFEVSTEGKPVWKVTSKPVSSNNVFLEDNIFSYKNKNLTTSTSASEVRSSKSRNSFESSSTEQIILKQNLMLKSLEKQINDLQSSLTEQRLVNSGTNTTSFFDNNLFGRRQSTGVRESIESLLTNPLRNSLNSGFCSDSTIAVPKIVYKPDSSSDED